MPKVRRKNLPRALFRHLTERVLQREITTDQLELLLDWLEAEPEVPEGRWFKRFLKKPRKTWRKSPEPNELTAQV